MTFRQHINPAVQCAGQNCAEAEHCARFTERRTIAQWASLDIERAKFDGFCAHRIRVGTVSKAA
jgi:hypothetical protein